MQISRRTFIASAALASFGLSRVAGQEDEQEENAGQLLQMVPGIVTAYARKYIPAESIPVATPVVEFSESTPQRVVAMMITFDSKATAQGVMSQMLSPEIAGMIMERDPAPLETATDPDLPKGSKLFFGTYDDAAHPYASLQVMPLGELVVLLNAVGDSDAIQSTVYSIAKYISEQEPGTDPVTVEGYGNARGGVFDMLPDVEQMDMLGGLAPVFDYDLLVSSQPLEHGDDATPEASPDHHHGH